MFKFGLVTRLFYLPVEIASVLALCMICTPASLAQDDSNGQIRPMNAGQAAWYLYCEGAWSYKGLMDHSDDLDMTSFVSDPFMTTSGISYKLQDSYADSFLRDLGNSEPQLARYFDFARRTWPNQSQKPHCLAYPTYSEMMENRNKLFSSSGMFGGRHQEKHWIPSGTQIAVTEIPKSPPPPAPVQSASVASSNPNGIQSGTIVGQSNQGEKKSATSSNSACRKVNNVQAIAEVRNNPAAGVHDLQLTMTNNSPETLTCSFNGHIDGHWSNPGQENLGPSQTKTFSFLFGNVSKPVAYRCVRAEDAQEKTTCFPPKWWLNLAPSTPHK